MVATGGAEDNLVLDGEGGSGELQVRLAIRKIGFPGDFAGFLIGGDDAGRIVRNRDNEIAP